MAKKEVKDKKEIKQKNRFFKDMKAELKKVIWPNTKQTVNNTMAVIAFTITIAVIVFVLDVVFDFANKKGIVALQEKVKSSYNSNNTTSETENEENNSEENSEENSDKSSENASEEANNSENSEEGKESDDATKVEAEEQTTTENNE